MPLIMIGSLALTLYCTSLLIEVADKHGDSFSEIAEIAYGPKMKKLTEILIICSQMGFCINYVYFISSQLGSIINCNKDGADTDLSNPQNCGNALEVKDNVNLWLWFAPTLLIIYTPLVWIRSMEKLAWTHLLGDVIIITVIIVIMAEGGIQIADHGKLEVNPLFTTQFFKAIPYSAFAFEGVAVVLPLRQIVASPETYFKNVVTVVSGICVFYIIYAEFANFAWGDLMEGNPLVTALLPLTSALTYAIKLAYTVNLFCSYPL